MSSHHWFVKYVLCIAVMLGGLWAGIPVQASENSRQGGIIFPDLSVIVWNPDGSQVAIAGVDGVAIYGTSFDTPLQTFSLPGFPYSAAWSPDGTLLALALAENNLITVWDTVHQTWYRTLEGISVHSLAWHPGGRYLAGSIGGTYVGVWDLDTYRQVDRFDASSTAYGANVAMDVCWSPDDPTLLYSLHDWDDVFVWNTAIPAGPIPAVRTDNASACSPDGRWVVRSCGKVMNLADESTVFTLPDEFEGELSFRWSPDMRYLASYASEGAIQVWDVQTRSLITTLEGGQTLWPAWGYRDVLAWKPDGSLLAALTDKGTLRLWDTATFTVMAEVTPDFGETGDDHQGVP